MKRENGGIHHITAIAEDPQRNVDFYSGVLGLRLVKLTVNHDDPDAYHLYFGDGKGRPGTILTFFAWPGKERGKRGSGQATAVSFSVPERSLGFWTERLGRFGIPFHGPHRRFEEEVIAFSDPDGLSLELAANALKPADVAEAPGPVPAAHAIRGFFGVTLNLDDPEPTAGVLTRSLGFRPAGERRNRFRYEAENGVNGGTERIGGIVDLVSVSREIRGRLAVGTVHHVAFRAKDSAEQDSLRKTLEESGRNVTPVIDRIYFRSIYFREPGGVLFEIATDGPGFGVDEPMERLGSGLILPAWLEWERPRLEKLLPVVRLRAS